MPAQVGGGGDLDFRAIGQALNIAVWIEARVGLHKGGAQQVFLEGRVAQSPADDHIEGLAGAHDGGRTRIGSRLTWFGLRGRTQQLLEGDPSRRRGNL
jgi:hypothetical protein